MSKHVAEIVDIIDKSGLTYKLGAMQTTARALRGASRARSRTSRRRSGGNSRASSDSCLA
ncbi:MAG: hypothetical protein NTW97_05805 [Candidatus Krumholzibacteria bacterium]|nr:hypothetical protein [Candidatus Krumholzibacteria bacterium]